MAKVAFSTLKLKQNKEVKSFKIGDKEVEITQYLSSEDKYDLIMITLQQCYENNIYNPFLKEIFFNLNLVFMYTNLSFTDKQKENLVELYDLLESNNIFNQVIELIPEKEYEFLVNNLNETEEKMTAYNYSIAGALASGFNALPQAMEATIANLQNFDPNQYKEVINFANSVGLLPQQTQ